MNKKHRVLYFILALFTVLLSTAAVRYMYIWSGGIFNKAGASVINLTPLKNPISIGSLKVDKNQVDSITFETPAPETYPKTVLAIESSGKNDLTCTTTANYSYKIVTKGTDPYFYLQPFAKNLPTDSCVLTFQYKLTKKISNFKVFFAPDLNEGRSAVLGSLEPTTLWKTASFNINRYRDEFDWGKAGDYMRIDPGEETGVTLEIRYIYLRTATAEEKQKDLEENASKKYITNGQIRLGIDAERGGCVFFFGECKDDKNMLNHYDEGRFVQQSYYGEADGSTWSGNKWVWNPVQGGGCNGLKAQIKSMEITPTSIHVVSTPVHWAKSIHMPELEMEEMITLENKVAHIHYTFRNNGENATDHPSTHQEMPAIFVDAVYKHLKYYKGNTPWYNGELVDTITTWPNEYHERTEEWAAYVNDNNYGIGVYTPGTPNITAYRAIADNSTGSKSGNCSYFAPIRTLAIKKGMVLEYDVYITSGTTEEIRQTFYDIYDRSKGFYKDLFMDSGLSLTSRKELYASNFLKLQMEYYANDSSTKADTLRQEEVFNGYDIDENGVLLYPDGAPRYRAIYVNGGKSTLHGTSLKESGRNNFRTFVERGGSYVGTCAGAFLSSKGLYSSSVSYNDKYLGIWPGLTTSTGILDTKLPVVFEKGSPLCKYYNFNTLSRIEDVHHNGGCYASLAKEWPVTTEILARFNTTQLENKEKVNNQPLIWAYKKNESTGRIVDCASHPEKVSTGDQLHLMSAMLQYAMEGSGNPEIKSQLTFGTKRTMDASTHDNNPLFTKIGDKQYHHFTIDIPENTNEVTISLKSLYNRNNYDMFIFANKNDFAWKNSANYKNTTAGFDKELTIKNPAAGKYYISVYCATTVTVDDPTKSVQYTGRLDVLNGVPYSIEVTKN